MLTTLPPPLDRLLKTPVLRSEMPAGFAHATVSALRADPRYHSLGAVRILFKSANNTDSVSFALFKSDARSAGFARTARSVETGGLFRVQVAVVHRIVIAVAATTRAEAAALITFGRAQLRRSEQ